jgi:NADP-dependent 3-hydroxy-3-methylglutaryl-CoA reductase
MNEKDTTLPETIPHRGIHTEEARLNRLAHLRERTGLALDCLGKTTLDAAALGGNIESLVGGIEIPVGVAGPLLVTRGDKTEVLYAPIATTEGALVSSIIRGAKAASLCGGIRSRAIRQRMCRAPIFELASIDEAVAVSEFVKSVFEEIREETRRYSNFADLRAIEPLHLGKSLHMRFVYETGDAAGQNMTTICTASACRWLVRELESRRGIRVRDWMLEGNLSSDKKASRLNALEGRGTQAIAECRVSRAALQRVLKTTPERMVEAWTRCKSGALYSGMLGFNVNVANVVAGIFAATGQDLASVHESSVGELHFERDGDDLYASLTMPSLVVGGIGGGTRLPAQRELLGLLGCEGEGSSRRLAEAICAFALALELSTAAAMVGGQFASAHERLGRTNERGWLKRAELGSKLAAAILEGGCPGTQVRSIRELTDFRAGDSLVIESASRVTRRLCGMFAFEAELETPQGLVSKKILYKVKPTDREVILATEVMASLCSSELAEVYRRFRDTNPFAGSHIRELELFAQTDPRFTGIAPRCFGTFRDDRREIFVVAEELLEGLENFDSVNEIARWNGRHVAAAIEGIAGFHALWLGREAELQAKPWLGTHPGSALTTHMAPLWSELAQFAANEFQQWFRREDLLVHESWLAEAGSWWRELEALPRTLVHHDFNPRNFAFRREEQGLRLCAYDWELATLHAPQRDLAELLSFTLSGSVSGEEVLHYAELHRSALERASGIALHRREWLRGLKLSFRDLMLTRLSMYFVAHAHRSCEFLPRVYSTARGIHESLERMGV